MQSRQLPPILFALIVAIAVVNALAVQHSWYWTMRWFDMPMHFAGGLWLAGMAIWFRFYSGRFQVVSKSFFSFVVWGVGAALVVGFAWEVYEGVVALLTKGYINAMSDTYADLGFDILGGLVVAVVVWMSASRKSKSL